MIVACEQKVDTEFLLEQYRSVNQQIEGCKSQIEACKSQIEACNAQMRGLQMQAASWRKLIQVDKQANKG